MDTEESYEAFHERAKEFSYASATNQDRVLWEAHSGQNRFRFPLEGNTCFSVKEDGTQIRCIFRKKKGDELGWFATHHNHLLGPPQIFSSREELEKTEIVFLEIPLQLRFASLFASYSLLWDSIQSHVGGELEFLRIFSEAMLPGPSPCKLPLLEEHPARKEQVYLFYVVAVGTKGEVYHFPLNSLLSLAPPGLPLVRPQGSPYSAFTAEVEEEAIAWLKANPGEEGVVLSIQKEIGSLPVSFKLKNGLYHEGSRLTHLKEALASKALAPEIAAFAVPLVVFLLESGSVPKPRAPPTKREKKRDAQADYRRIFQQLVDKEMGHNPWKKMYQEAETKKEKSKIIKAVLAKVEAKLDPALVSELATQKLQPKKFLGKPIFMALNSA